MDIQHCAERICEHRFGAAKIGEYSQKQKDVLEDFCHFTKASNEPKFIQIEKGRLVIQLNFFKILPGINS